MSQTCIIKIDSRYFSLSTDQDAICKISFLKSPPNPSEELQEKNLLMIKATQELTEYFSGTRKMFDLPLLLTGTEFQKKVWQALQKIPYGETRSYKQIAEMIGEPKAYRAVGMANNRNPLPFFIPCHRVIGSDGDLTGYAGGLELKKWLLQLESNHTIFK